MENLFDQFDIYIDTFCKSLQKQVEGIVQKSPNKKSVSVPYLGKHQNS